VKEKFSLLADSLYLLKLIVVYIEGTSMLRMEMADGE